jgi:hypothetical protein
MARRRFSLGGIGGYLVRKFVKQTKIHSWLADKPGRHQIALVEAEPDKGAGCTRILGKADAALGQEQSRLNPANRVIHQSRKFFPLLIRNGGPKVLDLNRALTDEDDLSHFLDSAHPGITNELRIQCGNTGRLLRISSAGIK